MFVGLTIVLNDRMQKETRVLELRKGYRKRVEDMHTPFLHYLAHYQQALRQLPH